MAEGIGTSQKNALIDTRTYVRINVYCTITEVETDTMQCIHNASLCSRFGMQTRLNMYISCTLSHT